MTKIITIIEDNAITGVKYGTVKVKDTPIETADKHALRELQRVREKCAGKIRAERTKHK